MLDKKKVTVTLAVICIVTVAHTSAVGFRGAAVEPQSPESKPLLFLPLSSQRGVF